MKRTRIGSKLTLAIIIFTAFTLGFFLYPRPSKSAALTSAKDTLSNSRLSYDASIDTSGISSGATTITIDTESVDDNTTHLFPGDTICFANSGYDGCIGNTTYTVGTIIDSTNFTITSALGDNLVTGDHVVATQSATHTIVFTTTGAVANGSVLIEIPAVDQTAASNDGFADYAASTAQGFDLNSTAASDIECAGTGPSSWDAETVTSSVTSGGNYHHLIFPFTGTLAASTEVTCTLTDTLINPAPATDHTQGTSDDLQITIETYDNNVPSSGNLVDNVDVVVAPIEAVFVQARVDETLDFSIGLVNTGATACGINPDITSTYNQINFGTLSLNTFVTMAHDLDVSTNASDGYGVTVIESDQMSLNGATCSNGGAEDETTDCIPDTTCDGGTCDETAANVDDWETATNNGFGYSLDSSANSDATWEWDGTSGTCQVDGTDFCAAQFADDENPSDAPVEIMGATAVTDASSIYVCYRISVGATQAAGLYYTDLLYTATPIF